MLIQISTIQCFTSMLLPLPRFGPFGVRFFVLRSNIRSMVVLHLEFWMSMKHCFVTTYETLIQTKQMQTGKSEVYHVSLTAQYIKSY